jgi:hypothetical protein
MIQKQEFPTGVNSSSRGNSGDGVNAGEFNIGLEHWASMGAWR